MILVEIRQVQFFSRDIFRNFHSIFFSPSESLESVYTQCMHYEINSRYECVESTCWTVSHLSFIE